jgi:hypothetical protein
MKLINKLSLTLGLLLLVVSSFSLQFNDVQAVTGQITPGAETNYNKLPYAPPTEGRIIPAAADFNDIQAKVNAAQPGDIIEVADGTINSSSQVLINKSGTANARIVIRAKNVNGVNIASCDNIYKARGQCFDIEASYVSIENFKFTAPIRNLIGIFGNSSSNNAIYNNTFDGAGSGASAESSALIYLGSDDGQIHKTENLIVKNTFNQPKNAAVFTNGGTGGTIISHNIIRGPHGIGGGEREALKNQCCESNPHGSFGTRIQFNSFYNWGDTHPYLSSFKRGGNYFTYNKVVSDAPGDNNNGISVRGGDNQVVVGNAMYGQHTILELYNSNNLVKYNKLFSTGNKYGKTSLGTMGDGQWGPTSPYQKLANSIIEDNLIYVNLIPPIDNDGQLLVGSTNGYLTPGSSSRDHTFASNNTFKNNIFVRGDKYLNNWFNQGVLANDNVWENNIISCISYCSSIAEITNTVIAGTNGNRVEQVSINPTDYNQKVTYDSQYVAPYTPGADPDPDTSPPTINSFTTQSDTAHAQDTILLVANVTDPDNDINKVDLELDGTVISSKSSSQASGDNYSFSFDTTTKSNGTYTLKAKAYDSANPAHSAEKTLTITIDNQTTPPPDTEPPVIQTLISSNGSDPAQGTIQIQAQNVTDPDGTISKIELYLDNETTPYNLSSNCSVTGCKNPQYPADASGSNYTFKLDTTKLTNGSHTFKVKVYDSADPAHSAEKTLTTTIDNTTDPDPDTTKPTITSIEPAAGSNTTVTSTLTIKANGVSDDSGEMGEVSYRITGNNIDQTHLLTSSSNDGNYSAEMNVKTLNIPDGNYTITVIAKDAAGNTSDIKTFTITVNNTTNPDPDTTKPTITSTEPAAGSTTTVTGTLTIKANGVSDDKAVASVGYTIDGGSLKPMSVFTSSSYSASLGSNYSATIDTTTLNNGDHTIVISAKDTSNNTSDLKTFTIKVSNSNSNNNNNNSGSGSNTSNNTANQNPTNVPVVFPPQTGVNILGATLQQTDYYINDEFIGSKLGQENLSISDVIFNTRKLQPGDYDLKTIGKYTDGTVNVTSKIVRVFSKSLLGKYQAPVLTSLAVLSLASGASYITHNHRQKAKKASR